MVFNFTKTQTLPLVTLEFFEIPMGSSTELMWATASEFGKYNSAGKLIVSGKNGSDQESLFLKERLVATLGLRSTLRFPWYLSCLATREYTRIESSLYCKSSPTLLMVIQTYAKMFNCLIWLYYFRDWMLSPDATQRIWGDIFFFLNKRNSLL